MIRASQAQREGDAFRQVLHSMNLADSQAELGFRWLTWSRAETYWGWFRFPWSTYLLYREIEPHMPSPEKLEEGRRLVEGLYRARAALALEEFEQSELAEDQLKLATELMPGRTREEHRVLAGTSSWTLGQEYDAAYLESESYAEFGAALAEFRRSYGIED